MTGQRDPVPRLSPFRRTRPRAPGFLDAALLPGRTRVLAADAADDPPDDESAAPTLPSAGKIALAVLKFLVGAVIVALALIWSIWVLLGFVVLVFNLLNRGR